MARVTSSKPTWQEHHLIFLCPVNGTGSSLEYPHNSEKSVNHATNITVNSKLQIQ